MVDKTRSGTVLKVIGVFVALLVVVAIVFAVQPPEQLDPHTPEGTAQGYFQAVNDGDRELAETFMTEALIDACHDAWTHVDHDETSRVVITDTTIGAETAEIRVAITVSYGDEPFGGGSYDRTETLTLKRSGDFWLIAEPTWPLETYACHEEQA